MAPMSRMLLHGDLAALARLDAGRHLLGGDIALEGDLHQIIARMQRIAMLLGKGIGKLLAIALDILRG